MSTYIVNGKNALRVTSDGKGLEVTTQFGVNNGSIWISSWRLPSSNYGNRIVELIQSGSNQVQVITDKQRLQFYWSGTSVNYQCSYGL